MKRVSPLDANRVWHVGVFGLQLAVLTGSVIASSDSAVLMNSVGVLLLATHLALLVHAERIDLQFIARAVANGPEMETRSGTRHLWLDMALSLTGQALPIMVGIPIVTIGLVLLKGWP